MTQTKNDLYASWLNKTIDVTPYKQFNTLNTELMGEFNFYKYIDDQSKNAEIASASDVKSAIQFFEEHNIQHIVLHFGHYFNADYSEVFTLLHYFKTWYKGKITAFSPEEIVFLAIVGNKDVDAVIHDIKNEDVNSVLGFLPESISDSPYYANDDELFIDDRHVMLRKLIAHQIEFIYPFNLGQVDDITEFEEMINFIEEFNLQSIILQPNPVFEAVEEFNYYQAQALLKSLNFDFLVPSNRLKENDFYLTDKSFEITGKFTHI